MQENNFKIVLENIKAFLYNMQIAEDIKISKIFDKDVAKKLRIPPMTFATMKERGSVPHKELILWCYSNGICINKILFEVVEIEGAKNG